MKYNVIMRRTLVEEAEVLMDAPDQATAKARAEDLVANDDTVARWELEDVSVEAVKAEYYGVGDPLLAEVERVLRENFEDVGEADLGGGCEGWKVDRGDDRYFVMVAKPTAHTVTWDVVLHDHQTGQTPSYESIHPTACSDAAMPLRLAAAVAQQLFVAWESTRMARGEV